jgi:hypothetical protein
MSPPDWKRWYAAERARLELGRLFDGAPDVALPENGALIFPHARLEVCGPQVAAVARAVVRSGRDSVLALGVLHGKPRDDAALRGIHGPGAVTEDEFSLDNFRELLAVAARLEGRPAPRLVERFPLFTGAEPETLPGFGELRDLVAADAALVATTDPMHHGLGYGTPDAELMDPSAPSTAGRALARVARAFGHLARHEFHAFLKQCAEENSDFRDNGPVLASLLGSGRSPRIADFRLVDYAGVVGEAPTWVAAALAVLA